MVDDIQTKIDQYAKKTNTDVIVYLGDILLGHDDYIINQCRLRVKEGGLRKNVLLILTTNGGDPNVAYRIARCLQETYKTFKLNEDYKKKNENEKYEHHGNFLVLVDSVCKSSGTLLCIGADSIIMSGSGQLGPIDVQLLKQEEVGERTSGLTPIQALQFLETQSTNLYRRHFWSLRINNSFSTKMAAQIATNLTTRLLTALYEQIDPIRLAEVDRSLKIAKEYGSRLNNGNLNDETLDKLITQYPSHAFVIDREEAKTLFKKIEPPSIDLREIADFFQPFYSILKEKNQCLLKYFSSPPSIEDDTNPPNKDTNSP